MENKTKTNEQALRAFLKELDTFQAAIFRERILKISEITRAAIKEDRKPFDSFLFTANDFIKLCDKIDKYLGFEENKNPDL